MTKNLIMKQKKKKCVAYNVGMCLWNYEPVHIKEILSRKPGYTYDSCSNTR